MRTCTSIALVSFAMLTACGGGDSNGAPPTGGSPTPTPTSAPSPSPTPRPTPATVSYLHVFGINRTGSGYEADTGDGGEPNGPLLLASDGNFYVSTRTGGVYECGSSGITCGAIVRLSSTGQETVLKSFGDVANDGYRPQDKLMQGQDGALYGVTAFGGAHGKGTIFRLTLSGNYSILYSFGDTLTDGITPVGSLVQGPDGSLYGATSIGGKNTCFQVPSAGPSVGNCGTIFRLAPNGKLSTVYDFGATASDGVQPTGSLLLANDGYLYGTTENGGANACSSTGATNNCGTVFRLSTTGSLTTIHSFGSGSSDGIAPQGGLIEASDGAFYGTTVSGGGGRCGGIFGCGTVFRISASGSFSVIYAFALTDRADGYGPSPHLIQADDGFLYGTTGSGGATQGDLEGTAFRLSLGGTKTILYSFGPINQNPHNPVGGLVQGSDGAFYGVLAYSADLWAASPYSGTGAIFRLSL